MDDNKTRLRRLLTDSLGSAAAEQLTQELSSRLQRSDGVEAMLVLLGELKDVSAKITAAAIDMLPELQRRGLLAETVQWLDLALALAQESGAATLRYLRESPLVLSVIEPASTRRLALRLTTELVEEDHAIALEWLRVAPQLAQCLPAEEWERWALAGVELSRTDRVAGMEFIRQLPAIVEAVAWEDVRSWTGFGLKLVTTNSLGKTDYLGTVEFFRTSPGLLKVIQPRTARALVITLGSRLADNSLDSATACLADAPSLLQGLPSDEWRVSVLQYALLVADRDPSATLTYLKRAPEIVALLGASSEAKSRFADWFRTGMDILEYSVDGGRAFFATETHRALTAIEEAVSGVPLRRVARSLALFAQALAGAPVRIAALSDGEREQPRSEFTGDRLTIRLPPLLRRYPSYEDNERLYKAMTAHEAGHLEFGTYEVPLSKLAPLLADLPNHAAERPDAAPDTLARLFACYPQPGVMRDLWTLVEDARVEYLLQREYPGLRSDLARLAAQAVQARTLSHGLTVRELIVDRLLLLSTAEDPAAVTVPEPVADVVTELWKMCLSIRTPHSTAEDGVRVAHQMYLCLDRSVGGRAEPRMIDSSTAEQPAITAPQASEEVSSSYRSVENWDYRGAMEPNLVRERTEDVASSLMATGGDIASEAPAGPIDHPPNDMERMRERPGSDHGVVPGATMPPLVNELTALEDDAEFRSDTGQRGTRLFRYPEWDAVIQDYRHHWCSVFERDAEEGSAAFVEETLATHRSSIRLLRRYFESLRPLGIKRLAGQLDGDELDLDAVVRRCADLAAGGDSSEHLYVREERKERDVATAVLVDVSGSTNREVSPGRRVLDIEKEGLVMLCEALVGIGDQFALYAYSGQGRARVDFIVLKDFDDPVSGQAARKLGGIVARQQNRDGAAIRHASRKLMGRRAKTKLLILLSDGRPLDEAYKDDYSLEDTKMALREARRQGITPVCITVDRDADHYVKRMYGDVRCIVIDHVERLPAKLPHLYHRLTA